MKYLEILEDSYKRKDIEKFLTVLNDYSKQQIHFNYDVIFTYVKKLIQDRKFNETCQILNILEKKINKYDIAKKICVFYFQAYNSKEAERIYFNKYYPINDICLLIEIYLREGKVKQAKIIIDDILSKDSQNYNIKKIMELKNIIYNYYKYNSFIKTEYQSFIENGNKLQKGHIVYLKNSPSRIHYGDYKCAIRPYLIWNIQDEIIYLFPLTTQCNKKTFIISKKKYPNNTQDMAVVNNTCKTTKDNILAIYSKLFNEDFNNILKNIFNSYRYGYRSIIKENEEFIKYYSGEPETFDIIEYINPSTREKLYYFIVEINDTVYKGIEIDVEKNLIVDKTIKKIKKNQAIFKIIKPSQEQLSILSSQIKETNTLSWKKVKSKGIKYICLTEENNICYCINEMYSPSYVQCIEINKDNIDSIDEELTYDEIVYIRKLLRQTDTKNGVAKKIKK